MPSRSTGAFSTFSTSVGTKIVIGITGLALFIYLLIHIAGNLMVFFGPSVFNKYAYTLESNPLIPVIEIGLLAIFLMHVYKTIRMFLGNQEARPAKYAMKRPAGRPSRKSLASSTMIVSGLWLLAFIVVHVKAFRYGAEYEWPEGGRDLYRLEMENFSNPLVVGFYVLSMVVVGSHLWHGISSAVQSLGGDHPRWTPRVLVAGKIVAVLIAFGFMVIAVWALMNQRGRVRV
ncbi:MAG TPA: succinate dehydrogenase cytochrome b subunit [Vicinamibacterales bacterium]|jgi:succinate dehydrogenase / fumarate reductase cytochrome b subunit|nr:succinate dehydrogenase cytochrome b subunit [Vicinamibacterales bacterium]